MDKREMLRRVLEADAAIAKTGTRYAKIEIRYSAGAPRHVLYSVEVYDSDENHGKIEEDKRLA